jgi:hypothetical protein
MRTPLWDEEQSSLVEPYLILPSQFFTRLQRTASWTGEQRLMAAILEDAIGICCSSRPPTSAKARTLDRRTWAWVRSDDRTWPFSFLRICEALGLAPSAVREGIRRRRGENAVRVEPRAQSSVDSHTARPALRVANG